MKEVALLVKQAVYFALLPKNQKIIPLPAE